MRGRWAQGLEPRFFCWIIKDRLAGSERPGGFARNHRMVRRQEELIWLRQYGFTHVVSLLDSSHNLHAYEEAGIAALQVPLGRSDELPRRLAEIYGTIAGFLDDPSDRSFHRFSLCIACERRRGCAGLSGAGRLGVGRRLRHSMRVFRER